MNYRLQLYTQDEDGNPSWSTLFLDVDMIDGFYLPTLEDEEPLSINLFYRGEFITVLQEEHIQEYLNERFSDNLIKE